jgi:hypothetical protein
MDLLFHVSELDLGIESVAAVAVAVAVAVAAVAVVLFFH